MPARRSSPAPAARLWLSRAGRFEVPGGAAGDLEPKDALLLAFLAIEGPTPRARLAELLWPDVDDERARGNLRQRLLRLRKTTGVDLVEGQPQARLADGVVHDLDGAPTLLDGFPSYAAGGLADWLDARRERRTRAYAEGLAAASARSEAEGRLDDALTHARAWADLEPTSEEAHRRVMKIHYLLGDAGAALAAFQRCAKALRDELGAEPGRETLALKGQIERAAPAPRPAPVPVTVPVTIARPPRLVGRDAELAMLARAWDEGHAFLVLGEAGMGKSRLLAEFAAGQRRVVVAQARPGDAGVPFATLARLLRTAMAGKPPAPDGGPSTELARVLPELAPAAAVPAAGPALQLQQAIVAVLADAQREGIRGIVLDDVHFADDASLDALRAVVGDDSAGELRWGFTQRPGEAGAGAQALRDMLEDGLALATVALAPLDVRAMAALVDSLGVSGLDGAAIAEPLVRHTGGNPMFALETLKQAVVAGSSVDSLPRPASVGALIERRLRQLSPPAIALARVAAVAGVDFSIELAEHVLKTPAVALADAWNELEAAQVLRGAAFAHDLVFEATLRSLPEAIATRTHSSIAEWLERADGEPARIAAHWEATATPQRALPWLRQAAERANAALRPREGVEFLVRAAAIEAATATPAQAFESLAAIVDGKLYVDRGAEFLPLLDELDELAATPEQRIHALLLRSDASMHRMERLDEGLDAARRAVALAKEEGLDWFRVAGALNVAILQADRGEYALAAQEAEALLPEARRWPDAGQRCNLLAKLGYVLNRAGRTGQALELFDLSAAEAHACRNAMTEIAALANAAQALTRLGRPDDALERLARADALRAAHDKIEGRGDANDWMASIALRELGRLDEALARAQVAIDVARARSPGTLAGTIVTRADVWLDLGQLPRAREDRELALRAATRPVERREVALLDLKLASEGRLRVEEALAAGRAMLAEDLQRFMALVARLRLIDLGPPEEAAATARNALVDAREAGFRGLEASALSRLALAEMRAGEIDAAVTHARLSAELAAGRGSEDLSWPAIVRNAVVVLRQAGLAGEARSVALRGEAWLDDVAARHVPPEFRESFLERHPVHRELLALARRLR